jgi:hypothetical protein
MFGILRSISKILPFIYSITSRETTDDVPRNPGWETQIYTDAPRPVCKDPAAKDDSHVHKLLFKATKLCTRLLEEHHMSGEVTAKYTSFDMLVTQSHKTANTCM